MFHRLTRYPAFVDRAPEKSGTANFTRDKAGLCADCANAQRIESSRGSAFLLCQLSRTDPRFLKYPRLPVLSCSGYAQSSGVGSDQFDKN
jgi:hypothetical protein